MAGEMAAVKAILAEVGYQITVDGRAVPIQQVDPSQLWNFYHVASIFLVYASYRDKGDRALGALDVALGGVKGPELMAFDAIRRCSKVEAFDMFQRLKSAADSSLEQIDNLEARALCQDVLACYAMAGEFHAIGLRGIAALTQRVTVAFDDLQSRAKAVFITLRPVIQELMGRPGDAQIEAAIDAVEAAQETVVGLVEDFNTYVQGLTATEDKVPDPNQPLNNPENLNRIKHVRCQLATMIHNDDATLDALIDGMTRAGSMIFTVVTAIQQIDQRLAGFGVSAPS
ncbi:MAG: hypothetical protein H7338_02220 [Candidatus Sericytochromatia bacterium]|nr:hypothetical protein [Candidatus Sericytochromatia bacterium]